MQETKQIFYTYGTEFWKAGKLFPTLFPQAVLGEALAGGVLPAETGKRNST